MAIALGRYTNGVYKACQHRIVSSGGKRHSLAFFCEPGVLERIAPHPRFINDINIEVIEGRAILHESFPTYAEFLKGNFNAKKVQKADISAISLDDVNQLELKTLDSPHTETNAP